MQAMTERERREKDWLEGEVAIASRLSDEDRIRILRDLLTRYHDLRTALAAYHAGPGNVDEWRRQGGGIRFPETRHYVDTVLDAQHVYADVYRDELGQ